MVEPMHQIMSESELNKTCPKTLMAIRHSNLDDELMALLFSDNTYIVYRVVFDDDEPDMNEIEVSKKTPCDYDQEKLGIISSMEYRLRIKIWAKIRARSVNNEYHKRLVNLARFFNYDLVKRNQI